MRTARTHPALWRTGFGLTALGVAMLAAAALATTPVVQLHTRLVSTGPPCGAGELCIHQSQVPTTAAAFSGGACGDLVSAHPDEDLWHFVLPSGGSFDTDTTHFTAIFANPSVQLHADSIGGPSDEFAFVYSPAGATLTWAFATDVTGTPVQDYFNLSGTCAASQSSSSSSSSSSSTTTSSSTTATGSVSATTTSDGTPTGGVQGITITTPNTGAGGGFAVLAGLLMLGGGAGLMAVSRRGRRPR